MIGAGHGTARSKAYRAFKTIERLAEGVIVTVAVLFVALETGIVAPLQPSESRTGLRIEGVADPANSFRLTAELALPVGTVARRSEAGLTTFETPGGGWIAARSRSGETVPEGALLTSADTFTLEDGGTLASARFAGAYSEALVTFQPRATDRDSTLVYSLNTHSGAASSTE